MQEDTDEKIIKKKWNSPELTILNIKDTREGYTPGTPEGLGYDPVISP
jgi:hypothetical protein